VSNQKNKKQKCSVKVSLKLALGASVRVNSENACANSTVGEQVQVGQKESERQWQTNSRGQMPTWKRTRSRTTTQSMIFTPTWTKRTNPFPEFAEAGAAS
jgi:hypothetical protein